MNDTDTSPDLDELYARWRETRRTLASADEFRLQAECRAREARCAYEAAEQVEREAWGRIVSLRNTRYTPSPA